MKALEQYLSSDLDLSVMGLNRGSEEGGYFCTPLGARVIGWAGVDGIHYCIIEGQGEIIFAVSPMCLSYIQMKQVSIISSATGLLDESWHHLSNS